MKQKTKIAICFFGYTGSLGRDNMGPSLSVKKISDNFHKYVAHDNSFDFDIYIHSWSVDQEDNLINFYNPTGTIIEPPKFTLGRQKQSLKESRDSLPMGATVTGRNVLDEKFYDPPITFSRYYSQSRSIELMKNSGIEYDIVMISRLDLMWKTHFDFSLFFNVLSPHRFYALGNHHCSSVMDFWLISNMDNIVQFGELSDVIFTPASFRTGHQWDWKHPETQLDTQPNWGKSYKGTLGNLIMTGNSSHLIFDGLIHYITPTTPLERKEHLPNLRNYGIAKNNSHRPASDSFFKLREQGKIIKRKNKGAIEMYMAGKDCSIARHLCNTTTGSFKEEWNQLWKLP